MKNKTVLKTIWVAVVLACLVPAAFAVPCVSNVPAVIPIGGTACIQVCPWQAYPGILLEGSVNGPQGVPTLVLRAGCNPENTDCNVDCIPLTPPSDLILGGDPYFPDQYFGQNECFYFYLRFAHDATWVLEIYTNNCAGCFCLSFDDQLPVEMQNAFTAVASDDEITLSWSTASESSNDRFEIRRNGSTVASLAGQGTSPTGRAYSWTDTQVTSGVEYEYALTSVDMNGAVHELGRARAMASGDAPALVTEYALYQNYPNPFNPSTQIAFDLVETANVTLKVYNPIGSEVATLLNNSIGSGHHAITFDGSNLTSGLYFYTITVGDHFTATRKMLLVK